LQLARNGVCRIYHFVVADVGDATKHEVDVDDGGTVCKDKSKRYLLHAHEWEEKKKKKTKKNGWMVNLCR
jgi:hypothetical protein